MRGSLFSSILRAARSKSTRMSLRRQTDCSPANRMRKFGCAGPIHPTHAGSEAIVGGGVVINGRVTGQREAIIRITIEGRRGRKRNVAAVVDTGFNGHLSLPQSLIADLRLPWKRYGRAI